MSDSPLKHLPLDALPEGWEPVGVVALIKCRDAAGSETWAFRTSDDLSDEEALGALVVRTELSKASLMDAFVEADED
jgi:hypothetical protein